MSSDQIKKTYVLKGIGVSPGVVIGKAYRFDPMDVEMSFYELNDPSLITAEIRRFKKALKEAEEQLIEIKKRVKKTKATEPIYIIDVHILILKDKKLISRTTNYIRRLGINAEWALRMTLEQYKNIFEGVEDSYIRGRISDVQYVVQRVMRCLSGAKKSSPLKNTDGVIVIARDLSPADTAQMKIDRVLGFATDSGGPTSHTAIVARSMELPAVAGLDNVTQVVRTADDIIVDGISGFVVVNPYPEMIKRYEDKRLHYNATKHENLKDARLPAITLDNYEVRIGGNIEFIEEIPSAIKHGAEYIGLYRTEFIYINRENLPTEEDHYNNYRRVAGVKELLWSTIRTFDLGGDKFPYNKKPVIELNPQMGLRAIRFCLKEVELFKTQLRALWRTSGIGKIKVLLPLISGVEEIRQAKKLLKETHDELIAEGVQIDSKMEVGAMIEVPSAVIVADKIAREVDFFSIGTNDLIQYALAIDRGNERLTYLYEPLHPAVLRLLKNVVDVAHDANIPAAMCGEMAGDPMCCLILLGLELDELSMSHLAIPRIKRIIRKSCLKDAKDLLKEAMSFSVASEVRSFVEGYMTAHYPEEFQRTSDD